jgi:hypothetical protein
MEESAAFGHFGIENEIEFCQFASSQSLSFGSFSEAQRLKLK